MGRRSAAQLEDTRRRIIAAAERCFADDGVAQTQVAAIAREANIGISAFYRQFTDKEELLRVILKRLIDDLRGQLVELRRGIVERTPLEQLLVIHKTFDVVFSVFAAYPNVARIVFQGGHNFAVDGDRIVWDALDEIATDIGADIERAQGAGIIRIDNPKHIGDASIGLVLQLAQRMLREGSPSPTEAANFCARFTFGALLSFMPPQIFERIAPLVIGFAGENRFATLPPTGEKNDT